MALDITPILAGRDPEQMMMNALQIKGQLQAQKQQAAMAPLQQQSAQLGVQGQQVDLQGKNLEVQQRQYQMDQQRRMVDAAQKAFSPQPTAKPTQPAIAPIPATPPPASPVTPSGPAAQPPASQPNIAPDEMPQLPPSTSGVGPATAAQPSVAALEINKEPDELDEFLPAQPAVSAAAPARPAAAVMTPQTPRAAAQPAIVTPQMPRPAVQPAATADPWEQFFTNMQQTGVHPQTIMAMRKEHQALLQGAANLTLDQQKILKNQNDVYADVAKTAMNQPDDATREQYYQSTGRPALISAGIPEASLPAQLPTGDQGQQFLQQHLMTAQAQSAVLSNVKEQQTSIAQILGAASGPQDYAAKLKQIRSTGTFLPKVVDLFPQQWTGQETVDQARAIGQSTTEQENAPKQASEAQHALLVADATKLANAALISPQAYRDTLDHMPHGRASQFPSAPPDDQYDPKAFSAQVASMGLTPQERSQAITTQTQRSETIRHNKAMEDLRSRSNSIRAQIAGRGASAAVVSGLNAQADLHDRLTSQAEQDRNEASQYEALLAHPTDASKDVYLPGGKPAKLTDATKQMATQQAQTLKLRAQNLENQATAIRARNHFGEFGGTAPAAGAPPAAPNPPVNPPAAAPKNPPSPPKTVTDNLPAGIHTFGNGQTWQKNADGSMTFVK